MGSVELLLAEAGIAESMQQWLDEALSEPETPPRPIALCGTGCEEIAIALVLELLTAGVDALVAPARWLYQAAPTGPWSVPLVTVVCPGLEEISDHLIEALSQRTALVIAGDVVNIGGPVQHVIISDLAPSRVGDIQLGLELRA